MKKITFIIALFTAVSFISKAQMMNCGALCILNISMGSAAHTMNVTVYNGDTVFVNYPSVVVVNPAGDTIGNINNLFFFFGQLPMDTVVHTIPTSLDSLTLPFTCTVYFTDNSSHQTCSYSYPMSCTVGVNESVASNNTIALFPNPATNELQISDYKFQITGIQIYNVLGECVYYSSTANRQSPISVDISNLEKGIYFVRIQNEKGVFSKKMVKQ